MTSHKRKDYSPAIKFPIYNEWFNRYRIQSKILNISTDRPSINTVFYDLPTIKNLILELKGDDSGQFVDGNNNKCEALLTSLQNRLKELEETFRETNFTRINQGFEPFEKYPPELFEQKYKIEARIDVTLEEIETLESWLSEMANKKKNTDDSSVLQRGLACCGKLRNNILICIDGQNVSMHEKGFLIIDDERSPYDGMKLPDYHKLAKQWHEERKIADEKLLIRMKQEARDKGEPIPQSTGRHSFSNVPKSALPKRPSWAVNYKENI